MAAKPKKTAVETHQSIAEQTESFLRSGGEIKQIACGISGYEHGKSAKQIVIGKADSKK